MPFNRKRKNYSLRTKITIANIGVVIGALLVFTAMFIVLSLNIFRMSTMKTSQAAFEQTSSFMQEQTNAFRSSIDTITLHEAYGELLNNKNQRTAQNPATYRLINDLKSLPSRSDISRVMLITDNGIVDYDRYVQVYGKNVIHHLNAYRDSPWYSIAESTQDSYIWTTVDMLSPEEADSGFIIFTRKLPYVYQNGKTYYIAYIKKSFFEDLIRIDRDDEYTSYFIMDNNSGEILLSSDRKGVERDEAIKWVQAEYAKSQKDSGIRAARVGDKELLLGARSIMNTNLTLVYIYSYHLARFDNIISNITLMALIALFALPLILLLSIFISKSITTPLKRLTDSMLQVSEGNMAVPTISDRNDKEVVTLTESFDYMVKRITELLEEQYNYGKQIKGYELKALQAQINPHFLYNTLDLVRWRAVGHKDDETAEIVTALSQFYRKSLSRGAEFVSLGDEVRHISLYIFIQNKRFDGKISLLQNIPDKLLLYQLPKLTLQPIVENSIIHGILETGRQDGEIEISAKCTDDFLCIIIHDNGCGMDEETTGHILEFNPRESPINSGYGLYNINERIKLAYGNGYGLFFYSSLDEGTTVEIRLPKQKG